MDRNKTRSSVVVRRASGLVDGNVSTAESSLPGLLLKTALLPKLRITLPITLLLLCSSRAFTLEPRQIIVVVNADMPASTAIGRYYCQKRAVPYENILYLHLGKNLASNITRTDYDKRMAEPIRRELLRKRIPGTIRSLLTVYGVPIKVGGRGPLRDYQDRLKDLEKSLKQQQHGIQQLEQKTARPENSAAGELERRKKRLAELQLQIDRIKGNETHASVDSELSMALAGTYELYRWQPNKLRNGLLELDFATLMVSRLDGPGEQIVRGLIDKAIAAENNGLSGIAYIDSRGFDPKRADLFGLFDRSLRELALLTQLQTGLRVEIEQTEKLFAPGSCPQAALYCGWYSLKKYVDAFDFVDGAVGYHIASLEAIGLRDPNSSTWCAAMIRDGITATLGAVAEPYLHAFPEPRAFFERLYKGDCLVEAYYRTKPFNSWQMVLIGDPLYRPFAKTQPSRRDGPAP